MFVIQINYFPFTRADNIEIIFILRAHTLLKYYVSFVSEDSNQIFIERQVRQLSCSEPHLSYTRIITYHTWVDTDLFVQR